MSLRFGTLGLVGTIGIAGAFFGACSPQGDEPPDDGVNPVLAGTVFPCDVAKIITEKCWQCHGQQPQGTPMTLLWWEDVMKTSQTRSGGGRQVAQVIADRINSPNSPMPPRTATAGALTEQERGILNAWLTAQAPPGDGTNLACQPTVVVGTGGTPNVPGGGGNGPVGGTNTYGGAPPVGGSNPNSGGAAPMGGGPGAGGSGGPPPILPDGGAGGGPVMDELKPVPPEPGECNMIQVRARQDASGAPYQVPSNYIDKYICFEFSLDFGGQPTQALQFKPAVGNDFVHHWLLYRKKPGLTAANGANAECLGLHPDAELMAGWAPGAGDWNMPKTVGMDMGAGQFILEIHYNNLGAPTTDNSGVDVCVTPNLRPNTAGISWLGSEILTLPPQQQVAMPSMCLPANQTEPIYIMRSWPHMHLLGNGMQAEIYRKDGTVEPLFNVPFDFNQQWQYDTPAIIHPGDRIRTTCHFFNTGPGTVLFGERTTEEMCYNFIVSYPAGKLVSFPQGIHANSCMGFATFP